LGNKVRSQGVAPIGQKQIVVDKAPPPKAHLAEYGGRGKQAKKMFLPTQRGLSPNYHSIYIAKINEWPSISMI
jgi:hypothetical protein